MVIPRQTRGVVRLRISSTGDEGISPHAISCRIDDIYGVRGGGCHEKCSGHGILRHCWPECTTPEFKTGSCVSQGADCEDCFARCKDQFTSAGGWSIKSTGSIKCPN